MLDVSVELDPINMVPKLIKEWPLLVNNLTLLHGLVACQQLLLKDHNKQFANDFREVLDYMIADLVNVLGHKPADMAAGSVFELLHLVDRRQSSTGSLGQSETFCRPAGDHWQS